MTPEQRAEQVMRERFKDVGWDSRSFVLIQKAMADAIWDAAEEERKACIAIIRQYLFHDTQRAVSWHEVQDAIAAIRARGNA